MIVERVTPKSTFFAVTAAERTKPPEASRTVPDSTAEVWQNATETTTQKESQPLHVSLLLFTHNNVIYRLQVCTEDFRILKSRTTSLSCGNAQAFQQLRLLPRLEPAGKQSTPSKQARTCQIRR